MGSTETTYNRPVCKRHDPFQNAKPLNAGDICHSSDMISVHVTAEVSTWHQVIHVWAPCACLLVFIPCFIVSLLSRRQNRTPPPSGYSKLKRLQIYTTMILTLFTFIETVFNNRVTAPLARYSPMEGEFGGQVQTGVYGLIFLLTLLEQKRGPIVGQSLQMSFSWAVLFVAASESLYNNYLHLHLIPSNYDSITNVEFVVDIFRFLVITLSFTLSLVYLVVSESKSYSESSIHPEDRSSWHSNLTLNWINPIIWIGFKRNLEESDVPSLSPKDKCCSVVPDLESSWKREELKCNPYYRRHVSTNGKKDTFHKSDKERDKTTGGHKNHLWKALMRTYGLKFLSVQALKCGLDMTDFLEATLTAGLINHIQNRDKESLWEGVAFVIAMSVLKCLVETAHSRLWFTITRISRHMKNSVAMLIFKKSMTIRNDRKAGKTNAEVINLISDDCDRVFIMADYIYVIAMAPLKIGIALCLLYFYFGWSMLVGVMIMILLIPLNTLISNRVKYLNNLRTEIKDKRIKLMSEIINGIKVLKLYAWEKSFMNKVESIRSEEVSIAYRESINLGLIDGFFRTVPFLVKIGAFGALLLGGGRLNATTGFVAVTLFQTLNNPLSLLSLFLPSYAKALVSLRRINEFLISEDIPCDVIKKVSNGELAIKIKDGNFSWKRSDPRPTLTNTNVKIHKGGLVAVVGMVGSGKSSLLSSILGEMEKLDGEVEIQGRLAYVPQEAWILNNSLRENVLFGSNMDMTRYRQVIHGCSLNNDIDIMEAGDRTEIGEKGINLSGGQKQRVSLARAVYNDADVYLLDDPLSAVDAHVGKHIFNKIISNQGLLKGKTRVLVTHGVQWLPFVDSIIVMKDGQVSETGTYEELLSTNGVFAQFLRDLYSNLSDDEDSNVKQVKLRICQLLDEKSVLHHEEFEKEKKELVKLTKDINNNETVETERLHDEEDKEILSLNGKLIDDEETEQGPVKNGVYLEYFRALGPKHILMLLSFILITLSAENCKTFVIKLWTDDPYLANASNSQHCEYTHKSWSYYRSFVIIGFVEVTAAFLFVTLTFQSAINAANKLHHRLLNIIFKSPMSFFDTTPSCRIVNRFSSDIEKVDTFGHCLRGFIERFFALLVSLVIIVTNVPIMLIFLLPVCLMYYFLYRINISTLCQLRRYKFKHRSPIFVHFSETLSGISSIRAYASQNMFSEKMERKIDEWSKFDTMDIGVTTWFGMRISYLYLFIQVMVDLLVVLDSRITAGMAGLVLIYAHEISHKLGYLVHLMSHIETEFVSLERVLDYTKKPTEEAWEIPETKPNSDWPREGHIVLKNYQVRYREGLDLVLKGVNCDIKKGEKIGIVGRTGAGKSSLTLALFRLIEAASGYIQVDNEMIAKLGLHDLRSKITILPQEPVIFAGSLRMNLDPFNNCTADELWTALKHSHLKSFVEGLPNQLDFECGEGGKNLSVGQRQLLCLARTLLRNTRILILDEATAAVDMETDELIQKTIRTEFKECTVLTIAHRLNTIMDYDRVLVLDQGLVKEFDSPNNLLSDKQSMFYGMAKDAKLVN